MRYTLLCCVVWGAVFCVLPLLYADAVVIENLKYDIEQKNEEIKRLEEEARQYRDDVVSSQEKGRTLKNELNRISRTIARLRKDITLTEKRIKKAALEFEDLALEITEKERSMMALQHGLASALMIFFEYDRDPPLELFVGYRTFSDFFRHVEYLTLLKERALGSLDRLRTVRNELGIKKAEAESKKEELGEFETSLRDQNKIQEEMRSERSDLLRVTKNQEALYQELLRVTEQKQEAILQEMEELEEELRKLVDPSSLPLPRKGILVWPADGKLSQGYGETSFTKSRRGRHFYKFHNGIDISAPLGTPVRAADEGTVRATGNTDQYCPRGAYGKYVVIDHKNNLTTMYAHLSLVRVSHGQKIEQGELVGYIGNSGLSTGSHLHFTLYDGRTVEIRLGVIGTCGLLPFGGSLNPLIYL